MMKNEAKARVSIRLPQTLWRKTKIEAIQRGINAQTIVAEALRLWFQDQKGGHQ